MSLLSWLIPTKSKSHKSAQEPESSGLSRMDPTRPVNPRRAAVKDAGGNAQPANRKGERMARRELLYTVVREAMVRAGVLSASYKFKVLSLDARGRQFLVMVDLSREAAGETTQLAEIEAMVAQSAKTRYDIIVTSVYWRLNEHVAVGVPGPRPTRGTPSQPSPLDSHPAPLLSMPMEPRSARVSAPVPIAAVAATAAVEPPPASHVTTIPLHVDPPSRGRFEPIAEDEVAAFKAALAAGVKRPAPVAEAAASAPAKSFDGAAVHGPQSYTLLTGFEDTEMPGGEQRLPSLSGTQYGDLN